MARTKNTRNSKKPRARKSTKQTATNGAQISNANASTKVVGRSRESFVHDAQRLEMKLKEEWKRCMQGLHQMRQHKEDEIVKLSDECDNGIKELMKVAEYEKMMIALEKEVEDAIKDFEEEVKKTGEALDRNEKAQKERLIAMINKSPVLQIPVSQDQGKKSKKTNKPSEGRVSKKRTKNTGRTSHQVRKKQKRQTEEDIEAGSEDL